jgi:hypothetical protein
MEKIDELHINAIGGMLVAEIFTDDGRYIAHISGQLVPLTPIKKPGDPIPIMKDKDYGPVEVTAETKPELMVAIRERIERDVGRIFKFGNDS